MTQLFEYRFAYWDLPPYQHFGQEEHRLPGPMYVFSQEDVLLPVYDCWVYVFVRGWDPIGEVTTDTVHWLYEVWVNSEGRCCIALGGETADLKPGEHERPLDETGFLPTSGGGILLQDAYPVAISDPDGEEVPTPWRQYRFFASHRRLPDHLVWDFITPSDPIDDLEWETLAMHGDSQDGDSYVRVMEPMVILGSLGIAYQYSRAKLLEWENPDFVSDPTLRAEAKRRQQKLFLAGAIHGLMDAHPDLSLEDNFDSETTTGILADAKSNRAAYFETSLSANLSLTTWADSDFVAKFAREASEAAGADATAVFLDGLSCALQGVTALEHGRVWYELQLQDPSSPIMTYVFPEETAPGDVFQVTRKSAAPILEMAALGWPVLIKKGQAQGLSLLERLDYAAGNKVMAWVDEPTIMLVREGEQLKEIELPGGRWEFLPTPIEAWLSHGLPQWEERGLKFLSSVGLVFEFVNFVQAANAVELDGMSILNLVGSTTDLIAGMEFLFKESDEIATRFLYVNIISGSIDTYLAYHEAWDESYHGDDSVAIGKALVCVGSGIGVVANLAILTGVAAATGPVGWVVIGSMILIAGGTALAAFTQDTPLETFLLHCEWGNKKNRPGSIDRPTWSPLPLRELAGNLDAQTSAILNLFANHSLASGPNERLTIVPTMLAKGAVFELEFECDVACYPITRRLIAHRKSLWRIRWGSRTAERVSGDAWPNPVEVRSLQGRTNPDYKLMTFTLDPGVTNFGNRDLQNVVEYGKWRVRLDTAGDEQIYYPTYGWVEVGEGARVDFASGPRIQKGPTLWSGWWDEGWLTVMKGEDPMGPGAAFEIELDCRVAPNARPVDYVSYTARWRVPWTGSVNPPQRIEGDHWPEDKVSVTSDGERIDIKVEAFDVAGHTGAHLDHVRWRVRFDVRGDGTEFVPESGFGQVEPGERVPLAEALIVFP